MTTTHSRADVLTAMADDMRAEQTYLGSCRESCDNSGRIRWDRLQRVIDHLAASPVSQPAAAPIDDEQRIEAMARAMNVATDGHDRYWTGYVRSATAALRALRKLHPAPSPADERAAFIEAYVQTLPPENREVDPGAARRFAESVIEARGPGWQLWTAGIAYARAANETEAEGAFIDIVFDGPPSRESGRFVEVEDEHGRSFNAGEWIDRGNGLWALRIVRSPAQAPVAWKTTHPAVCVPITEDREIAEQWRAHGYQVIEFFDRPVPAMAAEAVAIGDYDLNTSTGGRGYIAEFFAKRVRNHHYRRYIEERLAADFACALAQYLRDREAAPQPAQADARVGLTDDEWKAIRTLKAYVEDRASLIARESDLDLALDCVGRILQGANHAE